MSAFNNMMQKTRDRNWGGTSVTVACEPYISGYSFIRWNLPRGIYNIVDLFTLEKSVGNTNDMTGLSADGFSADEWGDGALESACVSVTPPGGTLNKVQFQGLGGSKWSVPGSIDYGNTITIKYIEFSGLPIMRLHRAWCNAIRDNKIGLTCFAGDHGITNNFNYNKSSYSATLLYWTTKPDGVTVEYAAAYSGLFPLKDPMDAFSGDINSVDKLEIDIDYNVDMIWHEDWVYKMAQDEALNAKGYGPQGNTLWSKDGFRGTQTTNTVTKTPSVI